MEFQSYSSSEYPRYPHWCLLGFPQVLYLLLSFLFSELNSFLFSPSAHLLGVQCFVLITLHPVAVFSRARHRVWRRGKGRNEMWLKVYVMFSTSSVRFRLSISLCGFPTVISAGYTQCAASQTDAFDQSIMYETFTALLCISRYDHSFNQQMTNTATWCSIRIVVKWSK